MNLIGFIGLGVFVLAWIACIVIWVIGAYHLVRYALLGDYRIHPLLPAAKLHRTKAFKSMVLFVAVVLFGMIVGGVSSWLGGWQNP
jgi:hypothetical protein